MANLEPTMFREYDLRGRVNDKEINAGSVAIIARAYGTMLHKRGIKTSILGHDLRTGSADMKEIAKQALLSTGIDVIDLGQVLTPIMYSAQYYYQSKGGMMITASHNPNGWLGFKLALGYSYTFNPVEMLELKQLTETEDFAAGQGAYRKEDYIPLYTKDVVSRVKIQRPVKILLNAGNGTAGPIVPDILRAAGCEVAEYLCEPDLQFKHYFPNPALEKMMQETGEQVVLQHADLGLAIDGDGDRLGTTDENGMIIWADRYLALLAREVLRENPGSPIIFDVKCSRALQEDIAAHGGRPVMWKTGHSYIKEKLHQEDAPLGGEVSGHIFFGKPIYYGFDDAVFTALRLAELLSKSNEPFSKLLAKVPTYCATPALQANCADEIKYRVVTELVTDFKKQGYNVVTFEDLKLGGRIEFPDGWALIRASSNLPVLVMRFEATTDQRVEELQNMIRQKLEKYPEVSKEWESG